MQMDLGLQPRQVWDCSRNGSGMIMVLQKRLQEPLLCKQLITPNAISCTGCTAGTHPAHTECCGSLLPDPSARVYVRLPHLLSHYMH